MALGEVLKLPLGLRHRRACCDYFCPPPFAVRSDCNDASHPAPERSEHRIKRRLEQSCKGTQRLIEQVRLVLDKDRREGIVEELLSVFICWEDPLAAVSLGSLRALVVARHPKPSRCRVEPWCGAEHAH